MMPDGNLFDIANPKFRQFMNGNDILEYTLEGGETTFDRMSGTGASSTMNFLLDADGTGVTRISGHVTDKLGNASNAALQRLRNERSIAGVFHCPLSRSLQAIPAARGR